jgi:hypothetical protein
VGLLGELPPVEDGFSENARRYWLDTLARNLAVIYHDYPKNDRSGAGIGETGANANGTQG